MIKEIDQAKRHHHRIEIKCSECGGTIRDGESKVGKRLCLICRARKLNDYFQHLRAYASP